MAASLIETMTEDFDPEQYHDTYREALEAVVQAKVEGNDVVRPAGVEPPEPKKQPADLTEILRASVAALKDQRGQRGQPAIAAKPAKAAAKDKDDDAKAPKTRSRTKAGARKASA
jgi:DNA end-binding protein Ku